MNVLSLFDGISTGQYALRSLSPKLPIQYFSSEVDPYAIAITRYNYPDTIFLGDVKDITPDQLPTIDLLIGGSPCTGFSNIGKLKNFEDPQSKLFFEFVRLLNELSPTYFLLENVKMKKEWVDRISSEVKVKPLLINSALVSAQSRHRFYWTNIPNVQLPDDRNIMLRDILGKEVNPACIIGRKVDLADETLKRQDNNTDLKHQRCLEVRAENKAYCMTTTSTSSLYSTLSAGRYLRDSCFGQFTNFTSEEREAIQTLPSGFTEKGIDANGEEVTISKTQRLKTLGNGWTAEVIKHLLGFIPELSLFRKGN